jgi:hypothetical protein
VFSERLLSLSRQFGMSRRLAQGAEGSDRSNLLQAARFFDVLFQVSHSHEIIEESR